MLSDGASICYLLHRNLPPNTTTFCAVYDYVEKADLSKGNQNPKRKLGVTKYFSEIIELKFGKKLT